MPRRRYLSKEIYYRIDFEIEVCFGQTMLCANVVWDEDVSCLGTMSSAGSY